MKKIVFLVILLSLVLAPLSISLAANSKPFLFQKFNSEHDNRYTAEYDDSGNIVNMTADDASAFAPSSISQAVDAKSAATEFLEKHSALFDIADPTALRVEAVSNSGNIFHVAFSQYFNGKKVHDDSEIYGGALWDLRKILGSDVTDKITHFSRNYLRGLKNPKFVNGLNALIAVDREFFGGRNAEVIRKAFAARGIKAPGASEAREKYIGALKLEAMNGDVEAQKLLRECEDSK